MHGPWRVPRYFTLVSYLIIIGDMFSVVIGEAMGGQYHKSS